MCVVTNYLLLTNLREDPNKSPSDRLLEVFMMFYCVIWACNSDGIQTNEEHCSNRNPSIPMFLIYINKFLSICLLPQTKMQRKNRNEINAELISV